jgi:hypothetical protein
MRSIVFVDKPLFQADAFHLLAGRKGMGKGTLLAMVAAKVTRGEYGPRRNVVWIGSEDSAAIDIHPRIVAAGGDPARVFVVKRGWVQLPRDIDEIGRAMTEFGKVEMVVIDPVGNHITGKESNSETDIRDAIAPLNQLADEHGCMVFGVRHLTEKEASQGVLAAILGSSAWVQVPRAVLAVVRDDEDPQVSHVQCVAGNRLPPDTPGRLLRIEGVLLPELENEVTRAAWDGDSTKSVFELLSKRDRPGPDPTKKENARAALVEILVDAAPGSVNAGETKKKVAVDIGASPETVWRAFDELRTEGLAGAEPMRNESESKIAEWRWFAKAELLSGRGE